MKTWMAAGLALAMAVPMAARAQAEGEGQRPFFLRQILREVRDGIKALNVTDAQKAQIRTILRSHREEVRGAADRAWDARRAVVEAIHQDGVDEALIRERVQEAAAAQADLAVLRARVRGEVRAVLTPVQRDAASRLHDQVWQRLAAFRAAVQAFVSQSL
jgi:Spy/CpxP family protein refolding chaperone